VVGIDIDINVVAVANENVIYNHLEDYIEIVYGDLLEQVKEHYEIVVAIY
jgi:methylase of polypeptide subunit release factors